MSDGFWPGYSHFCLLFVFSMISCDILKPQRHHPMDFLVICPAGFVQPTKRAHCFRIFHTRKPVNFDTAALLCSAYPMGNLAQVLKSDEEFIRNFIHDRMRIKISQTGLRNIWIGIRRWAVDQPFVYVATNRTVSQSHLPDAFEEPEGQGNCLLWDLMENRIVLNACDDDRFVDGFVCQANLDIYALCDKEPIWTSPCFQKLNADVANGNETAECWMIESKKVAANRFPCAINQTCVVRKERSRLDDENASCVIYCADNYDVSPKRYPCDNISITVEERCHCSSCENISGKHSGQASRSNPSTQLRFMVCICVIICFSLLLIIAFLARGSLSRRRRGIVLRGCGNEVRIAPVGDTFSL